MAGVSKITKLKLEPRIQELIEQGVVTTGAIAQRLTQEGHAVSQSAVARWLKETRDARRDETQQIVREHVQKTVPDDLEALEEMERQCLEWSREEADAFAHRLAARHITEHLEQWSSLLLACDPGGAPDLKELAKRRSEAVIVIMQQCLGWIADDLTLQKRRVTGMRMATQIIDLKLRYAGIIDSAGSGNVFFVEAEKGQALNADPKTGRLFVIQGGEPNA
jgi:arginine repressor